MLTPEHERRLAGAIRNLKAFASARSLPEGSPGFRVEWRDNTTTKDWGLFAAMDAAELIGRIVETFKVFMRSPRVTRAEGPASIIYIMKSVDFPGDDTVVTVTYAQ